MKFRRWLYDCWFAYQFKTYLELRLVLILVYFMQIFPMISLNSFYLLWFPVIAFLLKVCKSCGRKLFHVCCLNQSIIYLSDGCHNKILYIYSLICIHLFTICIFTSEYLIYIYKVFRILNFTTL